MTRLYGSLCNVKQGVSRSAMRNTHRGDFLGGAAGRKDTHRDV